ncbi:MAG: 50S ribosomal protein L11 methyltransferase [Pseudomonadota bacterium]
MPNTWKLSLPVSKADADALAADLPAFADLDPPPALVTSQPDPDRPELMQLDMHVEGEPDAALVATLRALLPTSPSVEPIIERVEDQDWVTISQQGLDPVRAGRFFVHTAKDRDALPADAVDLEIEAGQAFGTGHHPTTAGCLRAIDALDPAPSNVLDLGTGSALLALAAVKAFPDARVIASDIDAPSIATARENVGINGEAEGDGAGQIALIVADGLEAPDIAARAPFDLILANILAGPLVEMAADIAGALAEGGMLILAGLLTDQAEMVADAYREAGLMPVDVDPNEGWPVLTFTRG